MSIRSTVERQFGRPHGLLGKMAGAVMAFRPSNRVRNRWAVDLLNIQPKDKVLEIGCGPGVALASIVPQLHNGHVEAIDHSATMLAQTEARHADAISDGVMKLHLGGFERLPHLSRSFDKVLSVNVIQFLDDHAAAFSAILAALAPGGLAATAYQPRHAGATSADALQMAEAMEVQLADVGFKAIRTKWLALRPMPVICVLGAKRR